MRVRIIWFVFGAIVTLWVNAYTAELRDGAVQWFVGPSIEMRGPTDDDDDDLTDLERKGLDSNWLNKVTPRYLAV